MISLTKTRKKTAIAVVIFSAAAVWAIIALRPLGEMFLLREYARQIEQASGRSEAEALLRQAEKMGEPGLRVFVAGLGSRNEAVAAASRDAIAARMADWRSLRVQQSTPLVAALARELAAAVAGFDATARADAADFAAQILQRRLDRDAVDCCRVVLHCEKIMRFAPREVADSRGETRHNSDYWPFDLSSQENAGGEGAMPLARLTALPGGGLPDEIRPIPQEQTLLDEQLARLAEEKDAEGAQAGKQISIVEGGKTETSSSANAPRRLAEVLAATTLAKPSKTGTQLAGYADGPPAAASGRPLREIDTAELLRRLKSAGCNAAGAAGDAAGAAENELRCRGFKDVHFQIAAQLFDSDPNKRMETARRLPGIAGLNPRPWLMALAADENAEVRLTAITLLATAADPAVLAEVEELARRDPDSRIQEQAKRIAEIRAFR